MLDFEDLHEYRMLEVNEAVGFIRILLNTVVEPQYIKGAMDMLKKIINLPKQFAKTDEQKTNTQNLIIKLLDEFEKKTIRRMLEE